MNPVKVRTWQEVQGEGLKRARRSIVEGAFMVDIVVVVGMDVRLVEVQCLFDM